MAQGLRQFAARPSWRPTARIFTGRGLRGRLRAATLPDLGRHRTRFPLRGTSQAGSRCTKQTLVAKGSVVGGRTTKSCHETEVGQSDRTRARSALLKPIGSGDQR